MKFEILNVGGRGCRPWLFSFMNAEKLSLYATLLRPLYNRNYHGKRCVNSAHCEHDSIPSLTTRADTCIRCLDCADPAGARKMLVKRCHAEIPPISPGRGEMVCDVIHVFWNLRVCVCLLIVLSVFISLYQFVPFSISLFLSFDFYRFLFF